MKQKYVKLLLVAILTIGLTSCADFLEGVQTDVITDSQLQGDVGIASAHSFLAGAYRGLFNPGAAQQSHDDFGLRAIMLATDMMADDAAIYQRGFFFAFDYANDNRLPTFRRPRNTWRQLYAVILAANTALEVFKGLEYQTAETNRAMGEALALRGYMHFVLVNMFQQPYSVNRDALGIPIRRSSSNDVRPGRNTVAEVYEVILADLFEAFDLLEGKGMRTPATISEYVVAGMLARVLPFVNSHPNQWVEVARFAGIAAQGSPLMTTQAEFSSGFYDIRLNEVLWGSAIDIETNTFFASFFSNIDPFSAGYAGEIGFPILIASYLYNRIDPQDLRYAWFADGTEPWLTAGSYLPRYTAVKFTEHGRPGFTADYIYMRSSEFFYVKAEALFLNGDEAGARSALEAVMSTRLAGYSAAHLSGQALLNEIRIQKRIDTWGDGRRLFDMKWRGEAMDRRGSTNHNPNFPMYFDPNPKEWIFMIPREEMDANRYITENNP